MIIACATDRNYAELAGVLVNSIVMNGDVPEAKIIICDFDLREKDRENIRACAMGREVVFIKIEDEVKGKLSSYRRTVSWSRAMYCRLLLPDLISDTGRMVYLDSDMVVLQSLRPLFDMPMNGSAVGAVPDAGRPDNIRRRNLRLNRDENARYLNSGTLLIDLEKWRSDELGAKCLAYLDHTSTGYPDQDALNVALGDSWVEIEKKWNFTELVSTDFPREHYFQAAVLHYTWRKPHLAHCEHPARDLYITQRQNTPWKNKPLVSNTKRRMRREIKKLDVLFEKIVKRVRAAFAR
ncbi:glycosyltransferase family 8 protein [Agrobacterium vaccinii]|jgi:lipopolysaccharide biosynthesis glycosyltransferase|uniref:glycosyltransferase family 8 protein n=1 Tax=Agrobacterium vaccinii TaxID=2735528 RepID=UPI000DD02989|nr:glycosyltransferase family 8 protein [Agrobacterium vaccinii]UHS63968.1 glycosyltransferase family 8 protein [Agrobacterium vaccinii]